MVRVLRPGGRLGLTAWASDPHHPVEGAGTGRTLGGTATEPSGAGGLPDQGWTPRHRRPSPYLPSSVRRRRLSLGLGRLGPLPSVGVR
jgi:hypothetical protein